MYLSYLNLSESEVILDDQRTAANRERLFFTSKEVSSAFCLGAATVVRSSKKEESRVR